MSQNIRSVTNDEPIVLSYKRRTNVYEDALQGVISRIHKKGYIESSEARDMLVSTIDSLVRGIGLKPEGYEGSIFDDGFWGYSFEHFKKMIEKRPFIKTRRFPKNEFEVLDPTSEPNSYGIYAMDQKKLSSGYTKVYSRMKKEDKKMARRAQKIASMVVKRTKGNFLDAVSKGIKIGEESLGKEFQKSLRD